MSRERPDDEQLALDVGDHDGVDEPHDGLSWDAWFRSLPPEPDEGATSA